MDKKLMKRFLENPDDIRKVLLSNKQRDIVNEINVFGKMSARQLANIDKCTIQNASVQLLNLFKKGYLNRREAWAESGGREYWYTSAIDFNKKD